MYTNTSYNSQLYMAHFPLLYSPCYIPLLLTWHPPAVTGIVHLNPRLLVNWLPLSPIGPLYPSFRNPNPPWIFPRLNVHLIRAIHRPSSQYTTQLGTLLLRPKKSRVSNYSLNALLCSKAKRRLGPQLFKISASLWLLFFKWVPSFFIYFFKFFCQ